MFSVHALRIGQVALAWNGLHEVLSYIFAALLGNRSAFNIWHSSTFDRGRREMLRGAIKEIKKKTLKTCPALPGDLAYLLNRCDALEDLRNDVVHAPLSHGGVVNWNTKEDEDDVVTVIFPDRGAGNKRALKLAEKDLLAEYIYCRDSIADLTAFALSLSTCMRVDTYPWPNKPPKRARVRRKSRPNQLRRRAPERLPPRLKALLQKARWGDDEPEKK